jgi:septum formation inhibitor MinC
MGTSARNAKKACETPGSALPVVWLAERPASINIDRKTNGESSRNDPKKLKAMPDPVAISAGLRVWRSRTRAVKNGSKKNSHSNAMSHPGVPGKSELARSCRVAGAVSKENIKAQAATNARTKPMRMPTRQMAGVVAADVVGAGVEGRAAALVIHGLVVRGAKVMGVGRLRVFRLNENRRRLRRVL